MSAVLPPVLVVDDERNMRRSLETILGDEGYRVTLVESAESALDLLAREKFFMIITDAHLGGMTGYTFLGQVRKSWPQLPVLMITAYATTKLGVEAIKAGAIDYLSKPFEPEELLHAVARCAERHRLLEENALLRTRSAVEPSTLDQIIGQSPSMIELRKLIGTVAQPKPTAHIRGASRTARNPIA